MCCSLWSLICLFSHEDFDILLLVFHIPSLNSLKTYGKNMKVLQREVFFSFCILSENIQIFFFLVQRFTSHILCFLKWLSTHANNTLHLNINSLSIISCDEWTRTTQPHFFASDDLFPNFLISSSSLCSPSFSFIITSFSSLSTSFFLLF